jgi:hypothetical protein
MTTNIELARQAKQTENWTLAEKYYEAAMLDNSNDVEALFYNAYCKAKNNLLESDVYKRESVLNVLINCTKALAEKFDPNNNEAFYELILQINNDIIAFVSSNFVFNQTKNGIGAILSEDKSTTEALFDSLTSAFIDTLDLITGKLINEKEKAINYCYLKASLLIQELYKDILINETCTKITDTVSFIGSVENKNSTKYKEFLVTLIKDLRTLLASEVIYTPEPLFDLIATVESTLQKADSSFLPSDSYTVKVINISVSFDSAPYNTFTYDSTHISIGRAYTLLYEEISTYRCVCNSSMHQIVIGGKAGGNIVQIFTINLASDSLVKFYDNILLPMIRSANPDVKASSGGCYVATCVYGSYDCPEVWTLRRYRDDTLGKSFFGRMFIRTYYAISPTIVKWFGKTDWFKKFWKGKLDRLVKKLQSEGVESTPYKDKSWK